MINLKADVDLQRRAIPTVDSNLPEPTEQQN